MGNQLCEAVDKQPQKFRRQMTINNMQEIEKQLRHINTTSEIGKQLRYMNTTSQIEQEFRHLPSQYQTGNLNSFSIKAPKQSQPSLQEEQLPDPNKSQTQFTKSKQQSLEPHQFFQKKQNTFKISNPQKQTIIIAYKQFLIHSHPSQIRQSLTSPFPLITGHCKVYSLQEQNQLIYQGELRNSKFDGFGKMYQNQKVIYEGEFKNGVFDGWGMTEEYVGEWRQGVYDGYGIYQKFSQKNKQMVTFYYEGYFQNGLYSGSGVLIKSMLMPLKQISKIHQKIGIIDYLNQQIQHGMNIIKKYQAQQIYIGQFSNGFKHGFGRLFTQKIQFSGQFSHNLYHGLGTIFNQTNQGKKVIKAVFKMGKQFKQ